MAINYQRKMFSFGKFNTSVDEFIMTAGDSPKAINVTKAKKGSYMTLERRYGFADYTDVAGGDVCRGLFQWTLRDGTKRLIGVFGTSIKYWTSPSWTTIATCTNNQNSESFTFAPFISDLYMSNGSDAVFKWDHTTSAEEITTIPRGKFIAFHKEQLMVANVTTDTSKISSVRDQSYALYISQIDNPDDFNDAITGIPVVFNISGVVTGIAVAPVDVLTIFTSNRIEVITGSNPDDFFKFVLDPAIGSVSGYGLINAEGYIYFPALDGFYSTNGFARPSLISAIINGFYKNIDPQSLPYIQGAYDRVNRRLVWLVKTLDEEVVGNPAWYFNTILSYDLNLKEWDVYKIPDDIHLTQVTEYEDETGDQFLIYGTSGGKVLTLQDKNHIDNGSGDSSVSFDWESGPLYLDTPQAMKTFKFMRVYFQSVDRREIPITFYSDTDDPIVKSLSLAASTQRSRFLDSSVASLKYTLGTDSTVPLQYDFADIEIGLSAHYIKVKFGGDVPDDADLEFKLMAFELYYVPQVITGSPSYV